MEDKVVCSEGREIEIPLRETAQPVVWPPLQPQLPDRSASGLLAATKRRGGVQSALLGVLLPLQLKVTKEAFSVDEQACREA